MSSMFSRIADWFSPKTAPLAEKQPAGWWPVMGGGINTNSGIRVSEDSAMTFTAVFCATRIISETMASMPLVILRQKDYRTTEKETGHPLWNILHSMPNAEQDIFSFVDMQVAFQLNWGNCYAEIQRDSTGRVAAMWPIHPSRIPLRNIRRNPRRDEPERWAEVKVGQPGELVYYVQNDDNTTSPIPASDMLHIHGCLTDNGITGRSVVRYAANAIGIGIATEEHAGAFFRNGASTNMAIKSAKTVGPETAERLRKQWQSTFGGVKNHYKTLILEDGMEPVPINLSPQDSQLIEARKWPISEIARMYRIPPHMLGDLSRATWSNIESENLSFLVGTMTPWIRRWELAMQRQLLTPSERSGLQIKFNEKALLRMDAVARSQYYRQLFDMGSLSPNDIREKEDMNPIDGGDQYFVPANNLVPLDMIEDVVAGSMRPATAAPAMPAADDSPSDSEDEVDTEDDAPSTAMSLADRALRTSLTAVLGGFADREHRAAKQAAKKPQTFLKWQDDFYAEFGAKLLAALQPFQRPADALGWNWEPADTVSEWLIQSANLLSPLADLPTSKLADAVESMDFSGERAQQFERTVIHAQSN